MQTLQSKELKNVTGGTLTAPAPTNPINPSDFQQLLIRKNHGVLEQYPDRMHTWMQNN